MDEDGALLAAVEAGAVGVAFSACSAANSLALSSEQRRLSKATNERSKNIDNRRGE